MTASQVLLAADAHHVRLGVSGDKLTYEAERQPPKWLLKEMREHKAELLVLLQGNQLETETRDTPQGTLRGPRPYGDLPAKRNEAKPPTGRSVFERMERVGW